MARCATLTLLVCSDGCAVPGAWVGKLQCVRRTTCDHGTHWYDLPAHPSCHLRTYCSITNDGRGSFGLLQDLHVLAGEGRAAGGPLYGCYVRQKDTSSGAGVFWRSCFALAHVYSILPAQGLSLGFLRSSMCLARSPGQMAGSQGVGFACADVCIAMDIEMEE